MNVLQQPANTGVSHCALQATPARQPIAARLCNSQRAVLFYWWALPSLLQHPLDVSKGGLCKHSFSVTNKNLSNSAIGDLDVCGLILWVGGRLTSRPSHNWESRWRPGRPPQPTRHRPANHSRAPRACPEDSALSLRLSPTVQSSSLTLLCFDRHHAALQRVNVFMLGTDGIKEMHHCMQTLPGWATSAWKCSIHDKRSSEAASGQYLTGLPGRRWPQCECRPRTEGPVGQHTHFNSVDR